MIDFTTTRNNRPSEAEAQQMARRAAVVAASRAKDAAVAHEVSERARLAAAARLEAKRQRQG
jgi:hypothetical protein